MVEWLARAEGRGGRALAAIIPLPPDGEVEDEARFRLRCPGAAASSTGRLLRVFRGTTTSSSARAAAGTPEDRIALCAWDHLRGVHAARVRADGEAPHAIRWAIAVRTGRRPLLRLAGERYTTGRRVSSNAW